MASTTPNIGLYKKDPVADANDYFNIQTMLNDNWDALDSNQGSLAALRTALGLGATASIAAILTAMNTLIGTAQSTANGRARVQTGSYSGTGVYGSSNPNSLAFSFAPKLVLIGSFSEGTNGYASGGIALFMQTSATPSSYGGFNGYYILGGSGVYNYGENGKLASNTLSWYNREAALYQLNRSGTTYYWLAIG